jgi:hypothetical protein
MEFLKKYKSVFVAALLLISLAKQGFSQSKTVWKDLEWMEGHWKGEAFGGTVEELWNGLTGDVMFGMFWHSKDGKITFSEFEQISILKDTLAFRVKHFNSDLTGWEEKNKHVKFKFISSNSDEVKFEGLTLKKIDQNTCKHIITLTNEKTGKTENVEILYKRVK